MPNSSAELSNARKKEIVAACRKLYKTMRYREITLGEIAEETSFTRPSIYNYFETKEEIFLALSKRSTRSTPRIWTGSVRKTRRSRSTGWPARWHGRWKSGSCS